MNRWKPDSLPQSKDDLVQRTTLAVVAVATALVAASPSEVVGQQAASGERVAREARHWRCDAIQKWWCELPGGCEAGDPQTVWIELDFGDDTYQRCDQSGCTEYEMTVVERGNFTYLNLPEHPDTFMKVGLGDYFVEVVSSGVSAGNSFGVCRIQER